MLRVDLHVHIKRNCDLNELRSRLRACRLDGIAVTNHWTTDIARWLQKKLDGDFFVIVGQEIHAVGGHILGIGLQEEVPDRLSPAETIARIREQGALAVLPHPFLGVSSLAPVGRNRNLNFDLFEVYNYRAGPFLWPNLLASLWARGRKLPLLANSDAKDVQTIGRCYNIVDAKTPEELLPALRQGRIHRWIRFKPPTPAWFAGVLAQLLLHHRYTRCSVCQGQLTPRLRRISLVCERCGYRVRSRVQCENGPHFLCKRCRTRRDYALPALLEYRRRHGLEI